MDHVNACTIIFREPHIRLQLSPVKPDRTDHLAKFTQGVMRGPSPLLPGQRELIAALTSKLNQCLF